MTDLLVKPVPATCMVTAEELMMNWVGLTVVMTGVGVGGLTTRFTAGEVPPPGAALVAVMARVAAAVWSAAVSEKVTWVASTKVVARALPLTLTMEEEMKPVPP